MINKWCVCGDQTFNKWQIVWIMNGIHGYLMMVLMVIFLVIPTGIKQSKMRISHFSNIVKLGCNVGSIMLSFQPTI